MSAESRGVENGNWGLQYMVTLEGMVNLEGWSTQRGSIYQINLKGIFWIGKNVVTKEGWSTMRAGHFEEFHCM